MQAQLTLCLVWLFSTFLIAFASLKTIPLRRRAAAEAKDIEAGTEKFRPQVADLASAVNIEQYSWHGSISFSYQWQGTETWETPQHGWNGFCSCVVLQPQWCLTTYECAKPLALYESSHAMRFRVEWKSNSWWSRSWQSGIAYVDGYVMNATLGLALVYLDRSPFSRRSATGKGTLAFAQLAPVLPATNSPVTFLGMGQTTNGAPQGLLRQKVGTLVNSGTARASLSSTAFTFINNTQLVSDLWSVDQPLYNNVFYTTPVHCIYDWAGPLVDSQGRVLGLLAGYPGSTAMEGGPFVYQFQNSGYKYPSTCTSASDVFVDVTHPAAQKWIASAVTSFSGLKVTAPNVDRGDGVYNREVRRGHAGPYTFAFKAPSMPFHQLRITMDTPLQLVPPKLPVAYFNYIHGTSTPPDEIEYRVDTNSITLTWYTPPNISASSGFQLYPSIPDDYLWGTIRHGGNASYFDGAISVSLNLKAANDCDGKLFTVSLRQCLSIMPLRCMEVFSLSTPGGPSTIPTRCTLCNACVPHSYQWTEIRDMGTQCLTVPPGSRNVSIDFCDGTDSQKWMYSGYGLIANKNGLCLTMDHLGTNLTARVDDCDSLYPFLLQPIAVPERPNWFRIQTVGADYGAAFCLVSYGPWAIKEPCPIAFAERWYGNLSAKYYECINDGHEFLRTWDTLDDECGCRGVPDGPEGQCG